MTLVDLSCRRPKESHPPGEAGGWRRGNLNCLRVGLGKEKRCRDAPAGQAGLVWAERTGMILSLALLAVGDTAGTVGGNSPRPTIPSRPALQSVGSAPPNATAVPEPRRIEKAPQILNNPGLRTACECLHTGLSLQGRDKRCK